MRRAIPLFLIAGLLAFGPDLAGLRSRAGAEELRLPAITNFAIQGVVVDAATKDPVPGVAVVAGDASDVTRFDGRFKLQGFGRGSVILACSKPGFDEATTEIKLPAPTKGVTIPIASQTGTILGVLTGCTYAAGSGHVVKTYAREGVIVSGQTLAGRGYYIAVQADPKGAMIFSPMPLGHYLFESHGNTAEVALTAPGQEGAFEIVVEQCLHPEFHKADRKGSPTTAPSPK